MMLFRTTSAEFVDLIVNHPDIRPTIEAGTHTLESEEFVSDLANVVLAFEGGCALFQPQAPGVYKGHIAIMKAYRGAQSVEFGKAALAAMFDHHGALQVCAAVPLVLPAARLYVRRLGFRSTGLDGRGHELFVMEK